MQRADSESQPRITRLVDSQMSSREDSLFVSGSGEREPAAGPGDRCSIDEKVANEAGKAVDVVSSTSLTDPILTKVVPCKNTAQGDEKARERSLETKREIRQVSRARKLQM